MVGCFFQRGWQEGRPWLTPAAGDHKKAFCNVCNKSFSIVEGQTAVKKHSEGKRHVDLLKGPAVVNNNPPPNIQAAFKKSEAEAVKARVVKTQAREAEALLVTAFANHSLPETMYDCFSLLLPKMFPDSKICEQMSLGRTKGGYLLSESIGPHYHQQVNVYYLMPLLNFL